MGGCFRVDSQVDQTCFTDISSDEFAGNLDCVQEECKITRCSGTKTNLLSEDVSGIWVSEEPYGRNDRALPGEGDNVGAGHLIFSHGVWWNGMESEEERAKGRVKLTEQDVAKYNYLSITRTVYCLGAAESVRHFT